MDSPPVFEGYYENIPSKIVELCNEYVNWIKSQPDHHNIVRRHIGYRWMEFEKFWRQSGSDASWLTFVVKTDKIDRFVLFAFNQNHSDATGIIKMIRKNKVIK